MTAPQQITWKNTGIVVAVVAGMIAVGGWAQRLVVDFPPYAGIERVNGLRKTVHDAKADIRSDITGIRADIMASRAFNLRRDQCNAIKAGKRELSQSIAQQIYDAERVYMQITGETITLLMCSDL
jgi:hypothetical protein